MEKAEIVLLKENGEWKIDQHCWGTDGRCEKEVNTGDDRVREEYPLKSGSLPLDTEKEIRRLSSVKTSASPYVVDPVLGKRSQENPMHNAMIHRSPKFARFLS